MAKTIVIDSGRKTQVPFLRGIMTRSLQDSGLEFDDAYRVATRVRDKLSDSPTVTTRKLRANVLRELRRSHGPDASRSYRALRASSAPVLVEDQHGHSVPFSRAHHQRGLEACGLSADAAVPVTRKLYQYLLRQRATSIRSLQLAALTYGRLRKEIGDAAARRYLVWIDFVHSGRPLVLLIGGTAGCGKSTTATTVANRLEIVRTQSTDMLREVMRLMLPDRLLPVLHASSFDAWRTLPGADPGGHPSDDLLFDGFQTQAELLAVACEGVVQRALNERVSMILEGVHVLPSLAEKIPGDADALVVPIMLAVLDEQRLRKQIRGRGRNAPHRRAERYLERFDAIWRLQSALLSEADRAGVAIIENLERETVYQEIMRLVISRLADGFDKSPQSVFGRGDLAAAGAAD